MQRRHVQTYMLLREGQEKVDGDALGDAVEGKLPVEVVLGSQHLRHLLVCVVECGIDAGL